MSASNKKVKQQKLELQLSSVKTVTLKERWLAVACSHIEMKLIHEVDEVDYYLASCSQAGNFTFEMKLV